MKQVIALLFFVTLSHNSFCQKLKKYDIGKSGCTALFFCDPGVFEHTENKESADVYTGKCTVGNMTYGIICSRLKKPTRNMEHADHRMIAYLDKLKKSFAIVSAIGYGEGQRLAGNQDAHGIMDYWKTKDNNTWKIKCWTDGQYMAFMYASSNSMPDPVAADAFLGSLVFPGR